MQKKLITMIFLFNIFHLAAENQVELTENYSLNQYIKKCTPFPKDVQSLIIKAAPQLVQDLVNLLKDKKNEILSVMKRMFFYGPAGSGKSTLAQAIAFEIDRPCYFIQCGHLGTVYQNSEMQNLRESIQSVIKTPCVIILDEIDSLLKPKSKLDDENVRASQVWQLLDFLYNVPHVLLIATTNSYEELPDPLRTRFAFKEFEIKNPVDLFKEILKCYLNRRPHNIDDRALEKLTKELKNKKISAREVEELVDAAYGRTLTRKSTVLTIQDIEYILNITPKKIPRKNEADDSKILNAIGKFIEFSWEVRRAGGLVGFLLDKASPSENSKEEDSKKEIAANSKYNWKEAVKYSPKSPWHSKRK